MTVLELTKLMFMCFGGNIVIGSENFLAVVLIVLLGGPESSLLHSRVSDCLTLGSVG